jgi:hypothetical protein
MTKIILLTLLIILVSVTIGCISTFIFHEEISYVQYFIIGLLLGIIWKK